MTMMAASTEEEENAEWYSELERPESFYSDAAQYWEVGGEICVLAFEIMSCYLLLC